jgi:hypothetical protein
VARNRRKFLLSLRRKLPRWWWGLPRLSVGGADWAALPAELMVAALYGERAAPFLVRYGVKAQLLGPLT